MPEPSRNLFDSRRAFNRASETLYDDERTTFIVYPLDRTGAVTLTDPQARFEGFFTTTVAESDRERVQYALSSDAPKLYAFGREHRIFTFSGFLLDTNLDHPIVDSNLDRPWFGDGAEAWVDFFENWAGLQAVAQRRSIVELTYAKRRLYGAVLETAATVLAAQPHKVDQVFSFYVSRSISL